MGGITREDPKYPGILSIPDTVSVRWYVRDMYGGTNWEDPEYPGIPRISRDLLWQHMTSLFFALNTEMRWCALQTGRVYVKQHPGDAQLSLNELRDMVGREGQTFSNRVSIVSESTKTVICCSQKLACTSV